MHRIILNSSEGYIAEESRPSKIVYTEDRYRAQRFETEADAVLRAAALGLSAEKVDTETYAVA